MSKSVVDYEEVHHLFIQKHLANRTGERYRRLQHGHRHAESLFLRNVWWPLRGVFQDLHPEYEVLDWRGRSYFADLAWLPGFVKLIIEIKGYSTHVKEMDRHKYCSELNRETFLYAMGYNVISFAYDDVEQQPDLCITLLRMVLGRYQPAASPIARAILAEKEIIRLALQLARCIRPIDVEHHFGIDHKTAVIMLKRLCAKGWLLPISRGKGERVVQYELGHGVIQYLE